MGTDSFSITNTTKGRVPNLPFLDMKNTVLGTNYTLSLVFIGERRSRTLTKKYRRKDKVSNVLSFPLDGASGEIFITPAKAKREAPRFDATPSKHIGYLFIHALLHLKGYSHGSRMESKERALRKKWSV